VRQLSQPGTRLGFSAEHSFGIAVAVYELMSASQSLRNRCIIGIEPNKKRIREHLDNCLMLLMTLNPHIGYEKAAKISLTAYHEDLTLRGTR
jgi:fumarate hydratase, class II